MSVFTLEIITDPVLQHDSPPDEGDIEVKR